MDIVENENANENDSQHYMAKMPDVQRNCYRRGGRWRERLGAGRFDRRARGVYCRVTWTRLVIASTYKVLSSANSGSRGVTDTWFSLVRRSWPEAGSLNTA